MGDVFPRRGCMYWVNLEPARTREQGKVRPCVVLSNDDNNELADYVTILPTTREPGAAHHVVFSAEQTGLSEPSAVMPELIRAVHKRYLDLQPICRLPPESIEEVEGALLLHLGIEY